MKYILLFTPVVIGSFFAFSCTKELTSEVKKSLSFDLETFNKERAAWENAAVSSYQFTQNWRISVPQPSLKITVTKGTKTAQEGDSNGYAATISEVFERVEREFIEDKKHIDTKDDEMLGLDIKIIYNSMYHFPEKIEYYRSYGKTEAPGDSNGYRVTITDFHILSGEEKPGQPASLQAFDATVFTAKQAAWKELGIGRYRFTLRAATNAGPQAPVTVTVPSAEPPPADGPLAFASIDSLCAFIANVNNEHGASGAALQIRYNAAYHYPEAFSFSLGPEFDGGWYEIGITDFEPER